MKRIFIHVGAHKTGTTLLQNNLRQNSALLRANSVRYLPEFFNVFLGLKDSYPLSRERLDYIRGLFDRLQQLPEDNFLVSFEGLAGRLQSFYDNTRHIVQALAHATQQYDVHIIAVTRRQDTFIESIYHQTVKWGNWYPFGKFLDELVPPDFIRWTDWLSQYSRVFGRERVTVMPYERIFEGVQEYVGGFFDIICPGLAISVDSGVVENPGYSETALKIALACNGFLDYRDRLKLRAFLEREMPRKPGEKVRLFDEARRRLLLEKFREDNIRLFDEYLSGEDPGYYLGESRRTG